MSAVPARSAAVPRTEPWLDSRSVLALLLCVALVTGLTPDGRWSRFSAEALLVILALAAMRPPAGWICARAALMLPFFLVLGISLLLSGRGQSARLFDETLASALIRAVISLGALMAATRAAGTAGLMQALARLRMPPIIVTVIGLMIRYLELLQNEARRMVRARDVRGGSEGMRRRACVAGAMVGSLFVRSLERSERVSAAMQSRGFTGFLPPPPPRRLTPRDTLLTLSFLAVQALVVWLT